VVEADQTKVSTKVGLGRRNVGAIDFSLLQNFAAAAVRARDKSPRNHGLQVRRRSLKHFNETVDFGIDVAPT